MKYNSDIHKRHSIRINNYDYSSVGAYFITICAENRDNLFGRIENNKLILNKFGNIVENEWIKTSEIRKNVEIDDFIVMPNHFHGIIIISGINQGVSQYAPTKMHDTVNKLCSPSQTVGAIVRGFKASVTKKINILRDVYRQTVWQRNYFEHVIRNEYDLMRIREYIINNPANWETDSEYIRI